MTLVETLVAIVVLSIALVGIFAATITGSRTSSAARVTSQLNTLATGFAETLKSMPYIACAQPTRYTEDFQTIDGLAAESERLRDSLDATFRVLSVTDDAPMASSCPSIDSGAQRLMLEVTAFPGTSSERTIQTEVIKRTEAPLPRNESVVINDPVWRSNLNDPENLIALSAKATLSSEVYLVEWWCDASWVDPDATDPYANAPVADLTPRNSVDDPTVECKYLSPVESANPDPATLQRSVIVRVTDSSGRIHYSPVLTITLRTSTREANPPVAAIFQITEPPCTEFFPCTANAPLTVDGRDSRPGDGFRLEKCVWNFLDGSEEVVFLGPNCHLQAVPHTYVGKGIYDATLTVTNNIGLSNTATRRIFVDGPPRRRPFVQIRGWAHDSVGGWTNAATPVTTVTGVAPQSVQFSPAGSYAYDGATITSYSWTFGDSAAQFVSNASGISHKYQTATPANSTQCDGLRGYRATLTVTDSNNVSNSASMCVVLDPLSAPPGFSYTSRSGLKMESLFNWYIDLSFQWQTIAMTPGTPVGENGGLWWIEIQIRSANSGSCWLGSTQKVIHSPQVVPPSPTKSGTVRVSKAGDLIGVVVADLFNSSSCVAQARTVRIFDGTRYESPWSSPETRIR